MTLLIVDRACNFFHNEFVATVEQIKIYTNKAVKAERERCIAICMKEAYNGASECTDQQRRMAAYLAKLIEKGE